MKIVVTLLLLLTRQMSFAQETLKLDRVSQEYDLVIRVQACGGEAQRHDANTCNGPARVSLYKKGGHSPVQVLNLPNIELYKDTAAYNPAINKTPRGIYAEEYSVVFDDFDFDDTQDLAICNGRNGGYGSPSYNIYLFHKKSKRFVENRRLTRLTEGVYLGLFFPDAKRHLLIAYSKSGCCYHETEKYQMANSKPILVEKIIDDATAGTGGIGRVTTKKLVNGKWATRVRKEKINEQ
jgi:hypothetical protein